jgi:hypothetical protein
MTVARRNHPSEPLPPPVRQLPMIRLHDLRHLHATLLLLAGVPVHVVANRLGHSDRPSPCGSTRTRCGSRLPGLQTSSRRQSNAPVLANLLARRLLSTTKPAGQRCDLRVCGGQGRGRTADLPIFRRRHTCRPEGCQRQPCDNSCDNQVSEGPRQLGGIAVHCEV